MIQGSPWYQVYVDYARSNGILSGDEFLNGYGENITRGQMAHLFASALPQEALTAINVVESLPDVLLPNKNIGNLVEQKESGDPIRRML